MIETAIFLLFALLAVASSLMVVMHRNPVYSTMSLVVTLFSVAVLFVLLGAPFIAAIQILVYAVMVLFLFVVMLLNITREESAISQQKVQMGGALLGALLFGGLLALVFLTQPMDPTPAMTEELVSMKALAREMFGDFLLPFEIVGMLLLVAVIGATVAARKPPKPDVHSGLEPRVDISRSYPDPRTSEPLEDEP